MPATFYARRVADVAPVVAGASGPFAALAAGMAQAAPDVAPRMSVEGTMPVTALLAERASATPAPPAPPAREAPPRWSLDEQLDYAARKNGLKQLNLWLEPEGFVLLFGDGERYYLRRLRRTTAGKLVLDASGAPLATFRAGELFGWGRTLGEGLQIVRGALAQAQVRWNGA